MRTLTIDLDAIVHNYMTMAAKTEAAVLPVIKANAYGHGMVEVAKALESAGCGGFAVADVAEGLVLREAGVTAAILAWLHDPEDDFVAAVANDIDLGIANLEQLDRALKAAETSGKIAHVHLKIDTGLGRNGSTVSEWPALLEATKRAVASGKVQVIGIFSHLSSTGEPQDLAQVERFKLALAMAEEAGVDYEFAHLTASDGSLAYPDAHFTMIRVGIALYGLDPFSSNRASEYGLKPAMTATAKVAQTKRVPAGTGVSYGYLHTTAQDTTLALIPIGYAEGLPRNATGKANVSINGKLYPILGRIAMDQFVLDVGDDNVQVGDEVVLFGDPAKGHPSVDDLADAADTINYEIVTRMGGRFKRVYVGANA
jgi:alanine racemase